jgi:hypothetical protein
LPIDPVCRLLRATATFLEIRTMWKKALFGATALVIAGSAFVYAQQRPGMPGFGGHAGWRANPEDMGAFADARIAALHAGLKLTPDQEKSWPAVEAALRDLAKMRIDRAAARDEQTPASPIERLQRRADALTARGAALKRLADAAAPLYQSLDEGQKRRLTILARFMRPHMPHHAMMWRGRTDGREDVRWDQRGPRGDDFRGGPRGFRGDDGRGSRGMRGEDDYRGPLLAARNAA